MKLQLLLADICWGFVLQRPVDVEPELQPFLTKDTVNDISVMVSWDWGDLSLPSTQPIGEDLFQIHYREGMRGVCITKGSDDRRVAGASYSMEGQEIFCAVNTSLFSFSNLTLGGILRFLPEKEIFLRFGTLFLHASQIAWKGKGVLFSAPSGTGKTTQATLWKKCRGAEIVCNDRTLTRKVNGTWRTYGYPVDGSEPVCSSKVHDLGAVVLLEQGENNSVCRLRPSQAVPLLMRQVVIDGWNGKAREASMDLLLTMMEDIPAYLLTCTPDERAVNTLETKLTEDGVIPNGNDF